MDYAEIKQACESYRSAFDELDWSWFECDGNMCLPEKLVKSFEAKNHQLMRFLAKAAHFDVRPVLRNVSESTAASESPIACKCDALYPPYQRCSNC